MCCLRSLAGWTQDDGLSLLDGVVELFDDHVGYCLCFPW